MSFDASASVDAPPGGSIASYSWDFGDGGTGTGVSPHHSYSIPGHYTVSLDRHRRARREQHDHHAHGDRRRRAGSVVLSLSEPGNRRARRSRLTAAARATRSARSRPTAGISATAPQALARPRRHPYAAPGPYTVTLKVTNDAGQTATVNHSVTVDAAPKALFSVSPTAVTDRRGRRVQRKQLERRRRHDRRVQLELRGWNAGPAGLRRATRTPVPALHGRADGDQRRRAEHLLQPDRLGLLRTRRRRSRSLQESRSQALPLASTPAARATPGARSPPTAGASATAPPRVGPPQLTHTPTQAPTR